MTLIPIRKPAAGVCYYPEHWPQSMWADDARRMADLGLTYVRIGEFSWSRIEPRPDAFRFGWLDDAVGTLHDAGLKIIMGTPTATPPRWMLLKHPDMLAVDDQGRPRNFGSRRHYCFSHQGYRQEAVRITEIFAERYGEHEAVIAWQTDNEYGCHDTVLSYSQAAQHGFQTWLKHRYQDPQRLNEAWGNVFWSMDYTMFEEIDLPNLTVTEANPAHWMDFRRYSSDQVRAFNRAQVEILRRLSPGRALLHNYMGRIVEFDHFAVGEDLDIATWDSYPLGFLEDRVATTREKRKTFARQGDPDFQAFHHDLYRAVGRGRWWVIEQQPGPVNWAPRNPAPLNGMVRLWSMEAFAHGAEVVSWFRWRQAPFGQEQMHSGLLRPDNAEAPGYHEAKAVLEDLGKLEPFEAGQAPVGIVFDYESCFAFATQPQSQEFNYFDLVLDIYRMFRKAGLSIDFLPPSTRDFSGYRIVAIPGLFAWTNELRLAVRTFEGELLVGPRSGSREKDFSIPQALGPDLGTDVLDVKVAFSETIRPDSPMPLEGGGAFKIWREELECGDGTEAVMSLSDGRPAVVRQKNVTCLAGWPDEALAMRLAGDLCARAGLKTLFLSEGLRVRDAGPYRFFFNYGPSAVDILEHSGSGECIIGENVLEPGGLAVTKRAAAG